MSNNNIFYNIFEGNPVIQKITGSKFLQTLTIIEMLMMLTIDIIETTSPHLEMIDKEAIVLNAHKIITKDQIFNSVTDQEIHII